MALKRKSDSSDGNPTKKARKALSLETKMKVIKEYEGGKKVNSIARDLQLSHSTVSTILKDKERIKEGRRERSDHVCLFLSLFLGSGKWFIAGWEGERGLRKGGGSGRIMFVCFFLYVWAAASVVLFCADS